MNKANEAARAATSAPLLNGAGNEVDVMRTGSTRGFRSAPPIKARNERGRTRLTTRLGVIALGASLTFVSACGGGGDWFLATQTQPEQDVPSKQAAAPESALALRGPTRAQSGQPLMGVSAMITNPGAALPPSRLRLYVHGEGDSSTFDVRIDVQDRGEWNAVSLEAIDGGVFGAVGELASPGNRGHRERHAPGGFDVPTKATHVLNLRFTFDKPGTYVVVAALSPDNGATHLVTPTSMTIEVT